MTYVYKINWLFPVRMTFDRSETQNIKEVITLIKILGVKSLTNIIFRDANLKIVDNYNRMQQFTHTEATRQAIKYIKTALKENPEITSIEILRK